MENPEFDPQNQQQGPGPLKKDKAKIIQNL
jgi:hypothetical protein